ncbi:MAG: hypothetical protein ACM3VY_00260 [Candidatus Bathyarchaeota archaeon]
MTFPIQLSVRTRIVDESGCLTRDGVLLFQFLVNRTGGANGISADDLLAELQFDVREADTGELAKDLAAFAEESGFAPLLAAELAKRLDAADEINAFGDISAPQSTAPNDAPEFVATVLELSKRIDELNVMGAFTK